jgi:hypothetical protein
VANLFKSISTNLEEEVFKNIVELCIEVTVRLNHRDRPRASTLYSTFEHVKSLLIMGPNNTKNSSLKCDFIIFNY